MKAVVRCADKYEAQKLASMMHTEGDIEAQLAEVLNVIDEECIVCLRDSSVHSILLADTENATRLADFVQSIKDGDHKVVGAETDGDMVSVEKG